jgi:hypothetical protein
MPVSSVILDPSAPPQRAQSGGGWALDQLQGKVVGFIDNAKPNFNHLVDEIESLLTGKHGVARVVKMRKRAASIPAERAAIDALSADCDLVITGSGD